MKRIIAILALLLAHQSIAITPNEDIKKAASESKNPNIQNLGPNKISVFFSRLKRDISKSSIILKEQNDKIQVTWFINKKTMGRTVSTFLPLYKGEAPKQTSTTKKNGGPLRNNLYFYSKPLGESNGITAEIPRDNDDNFYTHVLSNFKIFISVKHLNEETLIPIATGTNESGCESNIFTKSPKLFCVQTSHPKGNQLNIGHKQGFTNMIQFKQKPESLDHITTSWKFFYGDTEI